MKKSTIQQKIHPLIGYVSFLISASLFLQFLIPVVFLWLLENSNVKIVTIIYASMQSFFFVSLYLMAVFFISPSYITDSKSKMARWFNYESLINCLILIIAHYLVAFIAFFVAYHFFMKHDYVLALVPDDILFFSGIFPKFDLNKLLGLSGFYFFSCVLVINFSTPKLVAEIFQQHIWRVKKCMHSDR